MEKNMEWNVQLGALCPLGPKVATPMRYYIHQI